MGKIYRDIRPRGGPEPDPELDPTDYLTVDRMAPEDLDRPLLEDETRRVVARMYPEGRPVKGFDEALAEAQQHLVDPDRLARKT